MRQLTLVFDLDAIVVDLISSWIDWYNQKYADDLTVDELTSYHIHDHVVEACGEDIYNYFSDPSLYESCQVLKGAKEGLRKLHQMGHRIKIATATGTNIDEKNEAKEVRDTVGAKFTHIHRAAPFLGKSGVYIGQDKYAIKGDAIIDDSPMNLREYRKHWPDAKLLTIAYPYNQEVKSEVDLFAHSYRDTEAAWNEIVDFIAKLSK